MICAGGGGIPTTYTDEPAPAGPAARRRRGRDRQGPRERAARRDLDADALADRHRRRRRLRGLGHAGPARDPPRHAGRARRRASSPRARWGRRCEAACSFVEETGGLAAIGSITDTEALLRGEAGHDALAAAGGTDHAERGGRDGDDEHLTPQRPTDEQWFALDSDAVAAELGVDRARGLCAGRGRDAARAVRPEHVRRGRDRAALARVRAPVPRPDADRPARRRASAASSRCTSSAPGLVLLFLTLFNAVLGLNQEGKAAAAVAALQKMMIVKARVRRDGELVEIPAEQLVPGRRRRDRGRRRRSRRRPRC